MSLQELARWEYDCLVRDTDGEFSYPGGWKRWCHEVFLIDDGWEEIRNNGIDTPCNDCTEDVTDYGITPEGTCPWCGRPKWANASEAAA